MSNLVPKKSGLNAFPSGEKKIVKESQWLKCAAWSVSPISVVTATNKSRKQQKLNPLSEEIDPLPQIYLKI
ncbi:Hypothetical predicted protein [Prunus dulcis]|uniref:Uncharacterized protein n=1 Tax=Prunus dulcis TaxID=3755 RepID=A0A5E4GA57_PRUDU|nr:Hypothetical predicted protein [Prunus dulcis]